MHVSITNFFSFLASPGAENVQAAQKYITGLDARRLSKLPEQRYFIFITFHFIHFSHASVILAINDPIYGLSFSP